MVRIPLDIGVDVPISIDCFEHITRTLDLELNPATMATQVDSFLASLTDELREKLNDAADSTWALFHMMGEDVN